MRFRISLWILVLIVATTTLFAQQTGSISGKVTTDNQPLPGVTVEARSNVLPQPRTTVTDANGEYRLPQLIPGSYTVSYTLSGMSPVTRRAEVLLGQDTPADVKMGVQGVAETITVTAEATLVNRASTAIESGISQQEIQALPVQQNYGDLQKLIPGVMFTADAIRGPSAGASGQDNVYMFDGANITMPLFGVLNQQPNTHDIAQVNIVKGGAKAVDFNRAGGFLIDTVSKSGTNKFSGEIGYQLRPHGFVADQVGAQSLVFQQDRSWGSASVGGPILADRLFFYGSYFRPEYKKSNQANLYGDLPGYSLQTDEYFGKLTFTPTQSILLNGTYRTNKTHETAGDFSSTQAPTSGSGSETKLQLGTVDGSWIIGPRSFASAKFTDYRNPGNGPRAETVSSAQFSTALGTQLNLADLASLGRLIVPSVSATNTAYNTFIQPFLTQYGYVCPQNPTAVGLTCTPGQISGGGTVGFGQYANNLDNFFRKNGQVAYNLTLGNRISHDLHAGYQRYNDSEDRLIVSNGWGVLTVPGGVGAAGTCPASACGASTPAFFVAQFNQQGAGLPTIHSEFHSQNLEINDTIRWNAWSFNAGLMASDDVLFGQGLARADNIAGYKASPGTKYKMHEYTWSQELQPRLGATWAYNGSDTVFSSYARYFPAANSDARAASWDRNLQREIFAYFDANGKLIGVQPNGSSSGKWFQSGIKPPHIDEVLIGTARQLTGRWSDRLYGRYRKGTDYVEDTNNTARGDFNDPSGNKDPYVSNLNDILGAIGSGSSYVIANLDGAFTKYLEATAESEWRGSSLIMNGSYTWSHYYGN
ncbi:MAG: carboxypeptidase regulatory-like domain-containing protein, partial [Thermoanaerobaculia bacterium]